jgi:hypothetical protein
MSKSKKDLLLELLQLENENVGSLGNNDAVKEEAIEEKVESIQAVKGERPNVAELKPKKVLTEKQIEALKKGQAKRDENREAKRKEAEQKALEEKKIAEEKLIKKAIAVRKKQIKKEQILNELSDDDSPVEKIKETKIVAEPKIPEKPKGPVIKFY